jgi:hypothetical protein
MPYPGTIEAITFGQFGSMYTDSTSQAMSPPTNKTFAAITMLEEVTFTTLTAQDADVSFNTAAAGFGTNGQTLASTQVFPRGVTIYGKWTSLQLASGSVVAYIGGK